MKGCVCLSLCFPGLSQGPYVVFLLYIKKGSNNNTNNKGMGG